MKKIIEIDGLTHQYPDQNSIKYGIRDITLSVSKGEFIILAGKNGSGKTTLLKHMNGLLKPDSGEILIDGNPIEKNIMEIRKKVGIVFQDADSQIVGETVFDDIAFGPENLKWDRYTITKKVNATAELLGLENLIDRNPGTLSGGEKRKLAIAGILVMEPDVILLDEPFSNLDFPSSVNLISLITMLNRKKITIIIATHDIEKIIDRAGRLIIMNEGCIMEDAAPAALMEKVEQHGIREPCSSKLNLGIKGWTD